MKRTARALAAKICNVEGAKMEVRYEIVWRGHRPVVEAIVQDTELIEYLNEYIQWIYRKWFLYASLVRWAQDRGDWS